MTSPPIRISTDPDYWSDRVADLRSLLATVQDLDLWPPWETVSRLVDLVSQAATATTVPPEPDPSALSTARTGWRMVTTRARSASADLVRVPFHVSTGVWSGTSGDAFRRSVNDLSTRVGTVRDAAERVEELLEDLETEMTSIQERHAEGRRKILDNLEISWSDLLPWEAYDLLTRRRGEVVDGIRETLGAYEDTMEQCETAARGIRAAIDGIELPTTLPSIPGLSTVDLLNGWDDDAGLLGDGTLEELAGRWGDLSPAEREAVRQALQDSPSDAHRAAILAGIGSGLTGAALANYLRQLDRMDREDVEALDPLTNPSGDITQPDLTTCGSSSLVMSRMLNDPAYAMWMRTGYDPETGETDDRTFEERFADESYRVKQETNGLESPDGGLQHPWPPGLGTPPYGAAAEMNAGAGVPGSEYSNDIVDPDDPGSTYDAIQRANEGGHTVPMYVGDEWSPRHVVLVTGTAGDDLTIYDPASGTTYDVSRSDFENGTMDAAGWGQAWTAILPE